MSMTYRSDAFPVCSMWKKLQTKCHSSSTYPKAQCIIRDDDFISWLHLKNCTHWRKAKQMQPMWICIFSGRPFKDTLKKCNQCDYQGGHLRTHENSQRRKVEQMQPMRLCIFSGRWFGETFGNTQRRKVKQMQPMWLCIFSGRPYVDTFKNTQWIKVNKCNQCDYASLIDWLIYWLIWGHIWKCTLEKIGKMSNKCNQCEFSFSQAGALITHLA